ncbi:hypothetical protein [Zunongwangia pacifica]|uniref:Quercetin 2,3-dioxygenase C-terminal cupin domain-containing protein n=1 Tax=Zunongwangia pacifica TaxID=2911062 RepID=A0A9X2A0N4_9FLAO|nr:hypothetical protein [Zunongwangia pacifica]MCL6219926.1 hypothetical protein [Zunongwangia pacifica]
MNPTKQARILTANRRNLIKKENVNTYETINSKDSFGSLVHFSSNILKANQQTFLNYSENVLSLIIPTFGGIEVAAGSDNFVHISQFYSEFKPKSSLLRINNPYEDYEINFLRIDFLAGMGYKKITDFNLKPNSLHLLYQNYAINASLKMGKYEGRQKGESRVQFNHNTFIYVISGAFEVNERLLETGETIFFWDINLIEFEALSKNAVFLMIEVSE